MQEATVDLRERVGALVAPVARGVGCVAIEAPAVLALISLPTSIVGAIPGR